jgi:site-specific DNA recombinase
MNESTVAFYARVSSEQQAEDGTIESQIAALRERIQQDGYRLSEEMVFIDNGYSGTTLIRPALERLRDTVALHGLNRLYVLCPDRLARKYAYQVLLIEEFQGLGVEMVFLNHTAGETAEDHLLLQMQGMIAEYERAKILERSRRGKRHAARVGEVSVLSGAPYGYRYISKRDGDGQARYEIKADEAEVVRQIYWWMGIERASIGEISRRLKQARVVSPRGKTYWDRTTIWGILKNPAYKGSAAFGKTQAGALRPRLRAQRSRALQPRRGVSIYDRPQGEWSSIPVPALVEEDLFVTVQSQLQENRRRARQSQRGAHYLLQGLLVCGQCGYAYYGKPVSQKSAKGNVRDYAYYRCIGTDAYRFGGERICENLQVRTDLLDQQVWEEVCDLLQDPQRLKQEYERRLNTPGKENENLLVIQSQMSKIQQGMTRLIDSFAEGYLQKQEFEPRITRMRQRLVDLEKQAQQITEEETIQTQFKLAICRLEEFHEKVKEGLAEADWQMRRDLIRTLVKRVEVGKDEVKIVFRIPPDSDNLGSNVKTLQHCRRGDYPSLRRPLLLPGTQGRSSSRLPFRYLALQPHPDQPQNASVCYPHFQCFHQLIMWDRVKRSHN